MSDNTMTINFTGSVKELAALLEKHSLAVFRFEASIKVDLSDQTAESSMIEELNRCPNGISAIKMYRNLSGCSLKAAKDFVVANCRESFPNLY